MSSMIDPKRLRRDAQRAEQELPRSGVGRQTTGSTTAVRAALPEIRRLRAEGVRWAAIAAALAGQGLIQGADRRPLSASRLTATVSALERRERRRADKTAARQSRPNCRPDHGLSSAVPPTKRRSDATP
jgi:hypothetical protein